MAEALVSIDLDKLAQVLGQQIGLFAGATGELEKIRNTFQSVKAFLRDAESKQLADESVRLWLSKLKAIARDIGDVLDESQIFDDDVDEDAQGCFLLTMMLPTLTSTCLPSPCACFDRSASRYKVACKIKGIRKRLDQIAGDKILGNFSVNSGEATPVRSRPQTGSFIEESEIIGRDEDKENVISRLVSRSSSADGDGQQVHVTAIVGIAGLGKTTLAQQIYSDVKVQDHFNQALYFVCVSEVFDVRRLIKAILEQVKGTSASLSELCSLQDELLGSLQGKRFLLVLDDVWNDDAEKWEMLRLPLTSGAQGSRILVTTRSERVANAMNAAYVHKLEGLSDDLSWTLFRSKAFAGWKAEEYLGFESIGREIVSMCKGVPLEIKVMGSVMNSKRTMEDWQNMLGSKMWSLPQVADKILPSLMLSYYNLPSHLKQCFTYCSLYEKGAEMDKDELVKQWVAQGFIRPQVDREMEDIGEDYFNDLVACSMFQEVDKYWGKTTCKLHDLLHDLAEFIMKDEIFIFTSEKSNRCSIDVRHASLFLSEDPSIPIDSFQVKKLRTLFVHGLSERETFLPDLFCQARFLRVLRWRQIKKLPDTIEILKHLRYLDLSVSEMVEVPESVSNLINLQTLNLNWCQKLKKLPKGMGRMVSLRHLQIEGTRSLECLPEGLGRLSCLRSLCKFMVGGEGGCGIDELQQLNSLQGSLQIQHLERVSSREEAEKAELWNKSQICSLALRMSSGGDEEIVMSGRNDAEQERMENVLDGLRPHVNLQGLELDCNSSSKLKLPSWMEDSSFSKLTELVIKGFGHCEENLLGLGKLPALKKLELFKVGVRKIGVEFYYGMSSNDVVGERRGVAFPKLETLHLWDMSKLEAWELTSEADAAPKVMPSLRQLEIRGCRKLMSLPHSLGQLKKLESFTIEGAEALTSLPDSLGQLESLEQLGIADCQKLVSLPHSLGQLKALKVLKIEFCKALKSLPPLQPLFLLQELYISDCTLLSERCKMEVGEDWHKISHIPDIYID